VFVRANTGHTFVYFDDMRNAGSQTVVNDRNVRAEPESDPVRSRLQDRDPAVQRLHQRLPHQLHGISFQQITTGQVLYSVSGSKGNGVEFELAVRPIENLQLALTGDYQKSEYRDNPAIDGNVVQRQPKLQFRFTPSYRIPLGDGDSSSCTAPTPHRRAAGPTRPTTNTCRRIAPSTWACCSRSVTRWKCVSRHQPQQRAGPDRRQFAPDRRRQRPDQRPSDLRPHLGSIAAVSLLKR
jgi:hypothetical protein